MSILLIWEEVPETTKVYNIPYSDELFEKCKLCHNYYMNQLDVPEESVRALDWLSNYLVGAQEFLINDCQDAQRQVQKIDGPVFVIVTGFIM